MLRLPILAKPIYDYIVGKIESGKVKPDPKTFIRYKELHDVLNLKMAGNTYGISLSNQGLGDLAHVLKDNGYPPLTGLVVDTETMVPGGDFFRLYNRDIDDYNWWLEVSKEAINYDWTKSGIQSGTTIVPEISYPDDLEEGVPYNEGAVITIKVNAYERNPKARTECIRIYGAKCVVCAVDFGEKYGEDIGKGFIHVHHLFPLRFRAGEVYQIDPVKDLRPVCPNCHAMLHTSSPPMSIEELKRRLKN